MTKTSQQTACIWTFSLQYVKIHCHAQTVGCLESCGFIRSSFSLVYLMHGVPERPWILV